MAEIVDRIFSEEMGKAAARGSIKSIHDLVSLPQRLSPVTSPQILMTRLLRTLGGVPDEATPEEELKLIEKLTGLSMEEPMTRSPEDIMTGATRGATGGALFGGAFGGPVGAAGGAVVGGALGAAGQALFPENPALKTAVESAPGIVGAATRGYQAVRNTGARRAAARGAVGDTEIPMTRGDYLGDIELKQKALALGRNPKVANRVTRFYQDQAIAIEQKLRRFLDFVPSGNKQTKAGTAQKIVDAWKSKVDALVTRRNERADPYYNHPSTENVTIPYGPIRRHYLDLVKQYLDPKKGAPEQRAAKAISDKIDEWDRIFLKDLGLKVTDKNFQALRKLIPDSRWDDSFFSPEQIKSNLRSSPINWESEDISPGVVEGINKQLQVPMRQLLQTISASNSPQGEGARNILRGDQIYSDMTTRIQEFIDIPLKKFISKKSGTVKDSEALFQAMEKMDFAKRAKLIQILDADDPEAANIFRRELFFDKFIKQPMDKMRAAGIEEPHLSARAFMQNYADMSAANQELLISLLPDVASRQRFRSLVTEIKKTLPPSTTIGAEASAAEELVGGVAGAAIRQPGATPVGRGIFAAIQNLMEDPERLFDALYNPKLQKVRLSERLGEAAMLYGATKAATGYAAAQEHPDFSEPLTPEEQFWQDVENSSSQEPRTESLPENESEIYFDVFAQ